jgi:hypothetical protein
MNIDCYAEDANEGDDPYEVMDVEKNAALFIGVAENTVDSC